MSDARAIICEKKLIRYPDLVIKYFMSPQNIAENIVGRRRVLFFFPSLNQNIKNIDDALNSSNYVEKFSG